MWRMEMVGRGGLHARTMNSSVPTRLTAVSLLMFIDSPKSQSRMEPSSATTTFSGCGGGRGGASGSLPIVLQQDGVGT